MPIIDIMVGVACLPPDERGTSTLSRFGYESLGEYGIPGRFFFCKGKPRSFHVHMVKHDSDFYERHILFRDCLRSHPEVARQYETLKRELARRYASDRDAYTEGKTEFVKAVLERARPSVRRVTRHRIPGSSGKNSEKVLGPTDPPRSESLGGK